MQDHVLYMPGFTPEQRKQAMEDTCESMRTEPYWKELTQEELDTRRETLAKDLSDLHDLEDEMKEANKDFTDRKKVIKTRLRNASEAIKTRKDLVTGKLYDIADRTTSMMLTYDENGLLVTSRRLRPEEKNKQLEFEFGGKAVNG